MPLVFAAKKAKLFFLAPFFTNYSSALHAGANDAPKDKKGRQVRDRSNAWRRNLRKGQVCESSANWLIFLIQPKNPLQVLTPSLPSLILNLATFPAPVAASKAVNSETKEAVAIKVLDKEKIQQQNMGNQIKKEISIMKVVHHPNIVQLKEVLASRTKIFIVLELVTGGELFDSIVKEGKFDEDKARKYFRQLIHGLSYCNRLGRQAA